VLLVTLTILLFWRANSSVTKQGNKSLLFFFDQLTVIGNRVIPHIRADLTHDSEEVAEALQSPRQEILPLG
jgi:hypothetical protein